MAIDGIGRSGAPPKWTPDVQGAQSVGGPKFEVSSPATEASPVGSGDLLGQVRSGEISLDTYLDARVGEAVQHLESRLPQEQLEFIKLELRRQLEQDPVLVELVRRSTGHRTTG